MRLLNLNRKLKSAKRLPEIVSVFARHGFGHILSQIFERGRTRRFSLRSVFTRRARGGSHPQKSRWWRFRKVKKDSDENTSGTLLSVPERLRLAFEELGPTFVKLGQVLSTRVDILSELVGQEEALAWSTEFQKLQRHAQPFDFSEVRTTIEQEFKMPLEKVFSTYEQQPFAAASIAQVHAATLETGESVVVKVQRPRVATIIQTDLNLLMELAERLENRDPEMHLFKPTELVREFSRSIRKEIDFTIEATNTDAFYQRFATSSKVKIPKVHWDFTNRRVLTLERIDGVPINAIAQLDEMGFDRTELAETLVEMFYTQVLSDGFFHADPHPGNVFVLEDGRIGLVDFGMVGRISDDMLRHICNWLSAVLTKDVDAVVRSYIRMGILGDETDIAALKLEMNDFLERYFNMPPSRLRLGEVIHEVFNASLRHQIHVPPAFLMLGKTVATVESVVMKLNPDFKILEFSQPYISQFLVQNFGSKRWERQLADSVEDFTELARDMPLQLQRILQKLQRGSLKFELEHLSLEAVIKAFDRVINRVAFSLIIASLIVGSSIILQGVEIWEWKFFLGIMGYLTATFFGFGLIISILRSGRF
ncbi:MAG: AarF/ABC1/UbiB kinase family protein [Candidatus Poribacteria bacterium]|nr:AarF/ABC1/UbiB kinase family protein [Candidatus Poribacteria bacterium]